MPFAVGPFELFLVLVIVLVVFGAGKLGSVGGAIGRGMREFRQAQSEDEAPAAEAQLESRQAPGA
jgi:sec-independent protein translocase protein TatA